MEKPKENKYIKQSINDHVEDGDYEGAIEIAGQFIADIISDEIETGKRKKWIDSFNNNTQIFFSFNDVIDQTNKEKKEGLDESLKKIKTLASNIFKRVESGEVKDASEEEKKELVSLVHEFRKIFAENK